MKIRLTSTRSSAYQDNLLCGKTARDFNLMQIIESYQSARDAGDPVSCEIEFSDFGFSVLTN